MPSQELSQLASGINRKNYKLHTHPRIRCYPSYHGLIHFHFPSIPLDLHSQPDLAVHRQWMVILDESTNHGQIANLNSRSCVVSQNGRCRDNTLIGPSVKLCRINEVMARDGKGDPEAVMKLFVSQYSALAMEHHWLSAGQFCWEQKVECYFEAEGQRVFRVAVHSSSGYVACHAAGTKDLAFAGEPVKSNWTERPYPVAEAPFHPGLRR